MWQTEFSAAITSVFRVSHNPSEIILICWFDAGEIRFIISSVETVVLLIIFVKTVQYLYERFFCSMLLPSLDKLNALKLNQIINLFDRNRTDLKLLNRSAIHFAKTFIFFLVGSFLSQGPEQAKDGHLTSPHVADEKTRDWPWLLLSNLFENESMWFSVFVPRVQIPVH